MVKKAFIVIHLEGSHDRYKDRVPPDFTGIQVDGHSEKVNDYDSSILYTDDVLKRIYDYGKDHLNMQAMVYASDHGEDMEYFHGDGKFTWKWLVFLSLYTYLTPIRRNIQKPLRNLLFIKMIYSPMI